MVIEPAQEKNAAQRRIDIEAKNIVWDSLIKARGIRYNPARFSNFECTHPGQQNTVDELQSYAKDFSSHYVNGTGINITGPCGTGKDYLLTATAHEVIRLHCTGKEKKGYYYDEKIVVPSISIQALDGMSFFSSLRAGMDQDDFDEDEYIEDLIKEDVLILSDPVPPNGGGLTDYQSGMLFRLIDGRYRAMKPIWASFNVASSTEAITRLTAPIFDRLRHGAICINASWPSFRKAGMNVLTK